VTCVCGPPRPPTTFLESFPSLFNFGPLYINWPVSFTCVKREKLFEKSNQITLKNQPSGF